MKLWKKGFAAALAATMTITSMAGCGGNGEKDSSSKSEDGNVKLSMTWWGNQVRNEGTQAALDKYHELHSDITINGQFFVWDDYWNKLATSAAGKKMQDLVQMDISYMDQYVNKGQLLDLTTYIESGDLNTENIPDNVLEMGVVGDGNYGIASGVNAPVIFYNKTLLEENGLEFKDNSTLDEFISLAKEVYEKTGYRTFLGNNGNYMEYWSRGVGLPLVDKKLDGTADDYIAYFKVKEQGIKEGWFMPQELISGSGAVEEDPLVYGSGPATMLWCSLAGGSNMLTAYQNGTNPGTDWVKEFRNKNAVVTNHALNVTGGSEFSKFSTGIGYQYQDGAFGGPVKTDYRRFTFRINSEHVIYRKGDVDVIKFGENIYYQHKQNQGVQLGNQYSNDLSNALRAIPLIPVYNENGDFFMYDDLKNFGTSANGILDYTAYASNPMAHMVYNQAGNNKNKNFILNTAAYLEVQPLKNLIYKGQVSYKQWSSSWRSYLPVYQINNQGDSRDKDQTINNVSLGWNWSLTNTLSYRFDITDLHHFDVLAGTEYSKSRQTYGESVEATGYNSAFGDFTHAYLHHTERKATVTVNGYPSDYGSRMSYFGRLHSDFKETYMFFAILRADSSYKFEKGNQWR